METPGAASRWRRRAAPATGVRGGNQASTTPACTTNLLNAACAGPRRPLDPFLAAFVKWLRREATGREQPFARGGLENFGGARASAGWQSCTSNGKSRRSRWV